MINQVTDQYFLNISNSEMQINMFADRLIRWERTNLHKALSVKVSCAVQVITYNINKTCLNNTKYYLEHKHMYINILNINTSASRRKYITTYKKREWSEEGTTLWTSLIKLSCHFLKQRINLKIQVKSFYINVLHIRLNDDPFPFLKEYSA